MSSFFDFCALFNDNFKNRQADLNPCHSISGVKLAKINFLRFDSFYFTCLVAILLNYFQNMDEIPSLSSYLKISEVIIGDLNERLFGERLYPSRPVFAILENRVDFAKFARELAYFIGKGSYCLLRGFVLETQQRG